MLSGKQFPLATYLVVVVALLFAFKSSKQLCAIQLQTTVTLMLCHSVPTLLGTSLVHVTMDTLEMEPLVKVRIKGESC